MANHKSVKKRILQDAKRQERNRSIKNRVRTYVNKVIKAVDSNDKELASSSFVVAQKELMKAVSKNVIKLNTASRKVSRLAKKVKNVG